MSLIWLVVLLIYGIACGWGEIHPLHWWMLLPFVGQDASDGGRKRRGRNQ